MANPFENQSGKYLILTNQEGQYSLWPALQIVPAGWKPVGPTGNRDVCIGWIESNWTDMGPNSGKRDAEKKRPIPFDSE